MNTFLPLGVEQIASAFPKYQVHHLIGVGGMSAVYQATQISLERVVAIKILPPQFVRDSALRTLFEEAAKAMARLNHPNLIAVHDFGEAGDIPFIIMEYVDGCSLQRSTKGAAINPAEVVRIISGVCAGLAYAHQHGVVHGDIKPANILLNHQIQTKIGDFGLARRSEQGSHPIAGSVHYSAPEVLQMSGDWDARVDVFSVGMIIHELLTGRHPAADPRPASGICGCDNRFDTIIGRATMEDPAARYSCIQEMLDEISAVRIRSKPVHSAAGRVPQVHTNQAGNQNSPASRGSSRNERPAGVTSPRSSSNPRKRALLWIVPGLVGLIIAIGMVLMRPARNAPTSGSGPDNAAVPAQDPGAAAEINTNVPAKPESDRGVNDQPAIVNGQPAEQPQAEPSIASKTQDDASAGMDPAADPVPIPDAVALDSGFRLLIDTRGDKITSGKIPSIVNTKINFEVSESELTPERLGRKSHVIIAGDMPSRPFSANEIAALGHFVARGNVLICAAQTWHWAQKSKEIHPLNELGRHLGFSLDGMARDPLRVPGTSGLLKGYDVKTTGGGVLSIVETNGRGTQLIVNSGDAPVAVDLPYGKGRILVFGHAGYFCAHPDILIRSLSLPGAASKDPVWASFLAELDGLDEPVATAMTQEGTPSAELKNKYKTALDRLKTSATAAGRTESITAVDEALGRLESGGNTAGNSRDPAVRELERIYLENLPAARTRTVKAVIEAASARFARLNGLVADMARAGNTNDASTARLLVARARSGFDISVKELASNAVKAGSLATNQPIQRGSADHIPAPAPPAPPAPLGPLAPAAPAAPAAGPAALSSLQVSAMINDFRSQFPQTMRKRCSKTDRLQRLKDNGGTPECEEAVLKGLRWLKSRQNPDGSWGDNSIAMTGLALLAYLGHCETPASEEFGESCMKGIVFLLDRGMKNNGKLANNFSANTWPYEHAIATYALGEAATFCKELKIDIPNLMEVTEKAGRFIINNQNKNGGWAYLYATKEGHVDVSITGWQVQALKACSRTPIRYEEMGSCITKALNYVNNCQEGGGGYGYVDKHPGGEVRYHTLTGTGMLCNQMWGRPTRTEVGKGARYILKHSQFEYNGADSNLYGHYHESQAMMQRGGEDWTKYNAMFRNQLLNTQNADGSWNPPGGGRATIRAADTTFIGDETYRNCLCILMLEVYYRFLKEQ